MTLIHSIWVRTVLVIETLKLQLGKDQFGPVHQLEGIAIIQFGWIMIDIQFVKGSFLSFS
jgi:hypothetical protein